MRRWRKKGTDEDELLTFDGLVEEEVADEEEEEEEVKPRRRYAPPRPIRTRFDTVMPTYDEDVDSSSSFEDLESMIRAGEYKPKQKDPYTAHILYQALRDLGEI